jgi:hypothetical protein
MQGDKGECSEGRQSATQTLQAEPPCREGNNTVILQSGGHELPPHPVNIGSQKVGEADEVNLERPRDVPQVMIPASASRAVQERVCLAPQPVDYMREEPLFQNMNREARISTYNGSFLRGRHPRSLQGHNNPPNLFALALLGLEALLCDQDEKSSDAD